jgi:hypothetical protein
MKNKKIYQIIYIIFVTSLLIFSLSSQAFASDPKLITTLNSAFEKLKSYLLKLATPAAAVAIGTGVFMQKFSFGDEEKIRTAKRLIRGSLFSYGFILCLDLVLSLMNTLLS